MMRLDPSLRVERLLIHRGAHVAYDESFHSGVNIIRGANSSGKSTVLNFLFYGLGGDLADWSEVAQLCTEVFVEVSINGKRATLCREVSSDLGRPMDIFGGSLNDALVAAKSEWVRYPYRRNANRESFSQALFRLLHMPEVAGESSGNITVHQILRLLYADQLSPVEHLFKFERFDPPTTRDAIGRLLCGAYDNKIYQNELNLRELEKQLSTITAEHRSLLSIMGAAQEGMTMDWIAAQRSVLGSRRASLVQEIEVAETELFAAVETDQVTLASQNSAYESVKEEQQRLGELQEKNDALSMSIADSDLFMQSLNRKLTALNEASSVASALGDVDFSSCPACFAPIEEVATEHACHLCKTPFDNERVRDRIVSLINDTALQIRQSGTLQKKRKLELEKIEEELSGATERWKVASEKLQEARRLPSTEHQTALRELHRQSGYLDREIEDLEHKAGMVELSEKLASRKAAISAEISEIKSDNDARKGMQSNRLDMAYTAISDNIREFLIGDLRRQDAFEDPKEIQFDFSSNSITVDGVSYFSASSRAILKSAFFLGMFKAAMEKEFFQHPRFLILDTIEDKGMEAERSQNFQRMIRDVSQSSSTEHQVIFGTAMIAPELDTPDFVVGRPSTRDLPTLNIGLRTP